MIRVSTFASQQLTLAQTLNSQRNIYDLQAQASSGMVSRDYSGIGANAHRLVNLKSSLTRTDQYIANNDIVTHRLTAMETSVSQIYEATTKFRALLVNALNAENAQEVGIADEAANFKQEVAKLLNVEQDGRFLFAGSRTATQPVDLAGLTLPTFPLSPPLTQIDSEYYKGDAVVLSTDSDVKTTISYGATADAGAFEYLIRAAHYVESLGSAPDRATLETALALVNAALGTETLNAPLGVAPLTLDLADLRTRIGISLGALESANTHHEDFKLYSTQAVGDIENVDVAAVISKLSMSQTLLEASYMTISRLSQMNLTQFLR